MDCSDNEYQIVILTLSTGKKVYFTGKAFCKKTDDITITDIQVTEPKPLPEGAIFSTMRE